MAPPSGPSRANKYASSSAYTSRRDPPRRDPYPPSSQRDRDRPDPKRVRQPPSGPATAHSKTSASKSTSAHGSADASPASPTTASATVPRPHTRSPSPIIDPKPAFDIDAVGPHPGYIARTQRFVCERTIQRKLAQLGTDLKDEQWRIQGVSCLDAAACRSGLGIPLSTVSTAVAFFHRFRLENSLDQFHLVDVVASALYLASKVENTARKPSEIAAACLNVNVPVADRRQPEDEFYDAMQDRIVDIERLMLEASSFEFRILDPKALMLKILVDDFKMKFRAGNADHDAIFKLVLNISKDLNYTFALIKHFHGTNAVACVELAFRLLDRGMTFDAVFRPGKPLNSQTEAALDRHIQHEQGQTANRDKKGSGASDTESAVGLSDAQNPYRRYFTTRTDVLETIMDLLDLFTVHRTVTFAGPQFTNEQIMQVKIAFNRMADRYEVPRHANDAVDPEQEATDKTRDYLSRLKLERDVVITTDVPDSDAPENANADKMQLDAPSAAASASTAADDKPADTGTKHTSANGQSAADKPTASTTSNGDSFHPPQQQQQQHTERRQLIAVRRFVLQASDAAAERRVLDEHFVVRREVYDGVHELSDGWESVSESSEAAGGGGDDDDDDGGSERAGRADKFEQQQRVGRSERAERAVPRSMDRAAGVGSERGAYRERERDRDRDRDRERPREYAGSADDRWERRR